MATSQATLLSPFCYWALARRETWAILPAVAVACIGIIPTAIHLSPSTGIVQPQALKPRTGAGA